MTRPIYIPVKDAIQRFYDVPPPDGFDAPENYPECCEWHLSNKKHYETWFEKFPDCCDYHRAMLKSSLGFDKNWYSEVVDKLLRQVAYTEHILHDRINNEDWYEDITDYLEYNLYSFGNPSVGGNRYIQTIWQYIGQEEWIPDDKTKLLHGYLQSEIDSTQKSTRKVTDADINKLFDLYERWVKAFPFSLSYFQPYEKYFKTRWPIISGKGKTNRYSHVTKSRIVTEKELIVNLNNQTNKLLQIVNTLELFEKGELSNYRKLRFDIVKEQYRNQQQQIFAEYEKGERKYLNTIKQWLKNELMLFRELESIDKAQPPKPEPTKAEKLQEGLSKYGFENLPTVKSLTTSQRQTLINKLAESPLPYKIAMLAFLGFFEHLLNVHFDSKFQMHKALTGILNSNERDIKGNIGALSAISKERGRKRYTAHIHNETVEKDYKNLK